MEDLIGVSAESGLVNCKEPDLSCFLPFGYYFGINYCCLGVLGEKVMLAELMEPDQGFLLAFQRIFLN